jgi:hypothetical protein
LRAEVQRLQRQGAAVVSIVVCTLGLRWRQRPLYIADTRAIRAAVRAIPGAALVDHRLPMPRLPPHPERRAVAREPIRSAR